MTIWNPENDVACECNVVPDAAAEPDVPIVFDETTGEYHLITRPDGSGHMVLYYCFFCGGRLPESRRGELFAHITNAELTRLKSLTREITSIDEVLRLFGEPDEDSPQGLTVGTPGTEGEPTEVRTYRSLIYHGLSNTADVHVTDYRERGIGFSFTGKPLSQG